MVKQKDIQLQHRPKIHAKKAIIKSSSKGTKTHVRETGYLQKKFSKITRLPRKNSGSSVPPARTRVQTPKHDITKRLNEGRPPKDAVQHQGRYHGSDEHQGSFSHKKSMKNITPKLQLKGNAIVQKKPPSGRKATRPVKDRKSIYSENKKHGNKKTTLKKPVRTKGIYGAHKRKTKRRPSEVKKPSRIYGTAVNVVKAKQQKNTLKQNHKASRNNGKHLLKHYGKKATNDRSPKKSATHSPK